MTGARKVKRNDPCPCGSGKKYKSCCLARDKAEQAERIAWERAAQDMRVALIGYAKDEVFVKDLAHGLGVFWQDRYALNTIYAMSVDESLRFFDWFAHDYALQEQEGPRAGKRLIEAYRDEVSDALSEKEAHILDGWIDSLPGSAFVLQETDRAAGTVVICDLFLAERASLTVRDASAARHGEIGQILLTRPLPEHGDVRLAGATAVLPAQEKEGLRAFIGEEQRLHVAERPAATDAQFLRERAYLFTHYALDWADREGRPAVAADDPDARRPGGKAMGRLVKWQQERVQIR
jgi:hypothetical protein